MFELCLYNLNLELSEAAFPTFWWFKSFYFPLHLID